MIDVVSGVVQEGWVGPECTFTSQKMYTLYNKKDKNLVKFHYLLTKI